MKDHGGTGRDDHRRCGGSPDADCHETVPAVQERDAAADSRPGIRSEVRRSVPMGVQLLQLLGVGLMAQKTVEGEEALLNVSAEERVTTTFIFTSRHFFLRLSDVALGKIVQMEKPDKQRKAFTKKVKARPDAEEIPSGAKAHETGLLISAALGAK